MQNTGKRCVILLVFIILRWSFNYEFNVFRYNKILIDCVFGNSKFVVPSTLTIHLGFASVNSQCLGDNKLAIPSYPVNKYIIFIGDILVKGRFRYKTSNSTNSQLKHNRITRAGTTVFPTKTGSNTRCSGSYGYLHRLSVCDVAFLI